MLSGRGRKIRSIRRTPQRFVVVKKKKKREEEETEKTTKREEEKEFFLSLFLSLSLRVMRSSV